MNLSQWKPKKEVPLSEDFFRFEHPFFGLTMFPELKNFQETSQQWTPAIDVTEEKDQFLIRADIPGIDKKDIELSVEGTVLSIKGERKLESEKSERNFRRIERSYGQFVRRLDVGELINLNNVKAKYENGVLDISIKKTENSVVKKIQIDG